jgi:cell division protein FtsN
MEDQTKLYVFQRKEVFLIFLFVVFTALASFSIGVKVGRDVSFKLSDFTHDDVKKVELLSGQEEDVNKLINEADSTENKEEQSDARKKEVLQGSMHESLKTKIMMELKEEDGQFNKGEKTVKIGRPSQGEMAQKVEKVKLAPTPVAKNVPRKDEYSGKYTIQLSSHRSLKDAEEFASVFKIRGYNPVISEVDLKAKGTWYRVSLGVFDTLSEAKEYFLQEKTLLEGEDYVFRRFD